MTVAISTGPETHLDHLAPICEARNIPLIITEEEQIPIAKTFYPMIEVQHIPLSRLTLKKMASSYQTIITTGKFWALELKPLFQLFHNHDMQFIFVPHGNSDKEALLSQPTTQEIQLVYGPQMERECSATKIETIGNIRLAFYKRHKSHFDALTNFDLDQKKKTILYAPTWSTKATTSSFFTHASQIIEELADEYNLLIKLHPLLEENDPASFHQILGKYESKVPFILRFPPIYPILEKTDIYIGDTSSIGYDFLYYDRPLFFLNPCGRLARCGLPYENPASLQQKQNLLSKIREEVYLDAFGREYHSQKIKP